MNASTGNEEQFNTQRITHSGYENVTVPSLQQSPCVVTTFDLVFNVVLIGSLSFFGLIGNTLSVFVLRLEKTNQAAIYLLQSLACCDNALLVLLFVTISLFALLFPSNCRSSQFHILAYVFKYVNPLGYMAQAAIIWMTVLIAFNRFVAICKPFQVTRLITPLRTKLQVLTVVFFAVVLNIPRIFQYTISVDRNGTANGVKPSPIGPGSTFSKVYNEGIYTLLVLVFPLVALVFLKVKPIQELYRMRSSIKRSVVSGRGRSEENISVIMVLIVLTLIICHTPDRILNLLTIYGQYKDPPPFYFANVCNFLATVNSSINFVYYYVLRRRFRKNILSRLCLAKQDRERSNSTSSIYSSSQRRSTVFRKRMSELYLQDGT